MLNSKGHTKAIQKYIQLLATHFGLAVKPCPLRPSSSASAGPRVTHRQRAHPHPRATLPHVVDITHASRFPHTTCLINIKKTLKPLKVCAIKTPCLLGFHICPVSFFSFFPRLSVVYQIPNFWSFLLVIIIILTNICLPLMCLSL